MNLGRCTASWALRMRRILDIYGCPKSKIYGYGFQGLLQCAMTIIYLLNIKHMVDLCRKKEHIATAVFFCSVLFFSLFLLFCARCGSL